MRATECSIGPQTKSREADLSTARKPNSRRPGGKPVPSSIDLDTIAAEVDLEPFSVTWQGQEWSFAHVESLDSWEIDQAKEDGDDVAILAMALGEQWKDFSSLPIPLGLMKKIMDGYREHCGISVGESGRSGRS